MTYNTSRIFSSKIDIFLLFTDIHSGTSIIVLGLNLFLQTGTGQVRAHYNMRVLARAVAATDEHTPTHVHLPTLSSHTILAS